MFDVLFRICQCRVQALAIGIIEIVPGVRSDQLDFGAFGQIRRFVHDQPTASNVAFQANHGGSVTRSLVGGQDAE